MAEYKKTKTEDFKNSNPKVALVKVMEHYGDEVPTSTSKNAHCPFHDDKKPSFNITNEGLFKCFSECGAKGDAFDYIMLKEGCNFQEALKIAGKIFGTHEDRNGRAMSKTELLSNFIRENFTEFAGDEDYKYEEHYIYKDADNKSVFVKIKFRRASDNDKTFVMANLIDDGKVYRMDTKSEKINIFYNTHLIKKAIEEDKHIYIVEGEKDADTLTKLGFVAISCRNTKNLTQEMVDILHGARIVVVPDMDDVGGDHAEVLEECLLDSVKSFRVLKLYEVKKQGKKDVSDYVEILKEKGLGSAVIKKRIEKLTMSSLDLKNIFELQQDRNGIKKYKIETNKETGEQFVTLKYMSNFYVKEARLCVNEDTGSEDIEIIIERYKFRYDEKPERKIIRGEIGELFTDLNTFKSILGRASFYGKSPDLVTLKEWIEKYFLVDERYEYQGVGIREDIYINGEYQKCLLTHSGALMLDGTFNTEVKAVTPYAVIDLKGRKMLEKDDANALIDHMFHYTTEKNALNTWGSVVASMLNPYYRGSTQNPHVLHIVGASGTGKSFVLEEIITPVLGVDCALSFMDTTAHALKLAFDATNIVTLMDEVKPKKAIPARLNTLSGAIRELTGSTKGLKGRKDQGANQTSYNSTLIMVGEELIEETAIQNRSNIVLYTDTTTTPKHIEHGEIIKTPEFREKLEDLGYSLYHEILANWNSKKINEVKEYILEKYPVDADMKLRERGTYINTVMGLIILQNVLRKASGRPKLNIVDKSISLIKSNLAEHVTENGEGAKQNYELFLEKFEELVATSDGRFRLDCGIHFRKVIEGGEDCLAIAFTDSYNVVFEAQQRIGEKLENNRTIKKLLMNSKYAHEIKTKKYKFNVSPIEKKTKDALVLKFSALKELDMQNTLEVAEEFYRKER